MIMDKFYRKILKINYLHSKHEVEKRCLLT